VAVCFCSTKQFGGLLPGQRQFRLGAREQHVIHKWEQGYHYLCRGGARPSTGDGLLSGGLCDCPFPWNWSGSSSHNVTFYRPFALRRAESTRAAHYPEFSGFKGDKYGDERATLGLRLVAIIVPLRPPARGKEQG